MSSRGRKIFSNLVTEEDGRALGRRIAPPQKEGLLQAGKGGGPVMGTGKTVRHRVTLPGSFAWDSAPSQWEWSKFPYSNHIK